MPQTCLKLTLSRLSPQRRGIASGVVPRETATARLPSGWAPLGYFPAAPTVVEPQSADLGTLPDAPATAGGPSDDNADDFNPASGSGVEYPKLSSSARADDGISPPPSNTDDIELRLNYAEQGAGHDENVWSSSPDADEDSHGFELGGSSASAPLDDIELKMAGAYPQNPEPEHYSTTAQRHQSPGPSTTMATSSSSVVPEHSRGDKGKGRVAPTQPEQAIQPAPPPVAPTERSDRPPIRYDHKHDRIEMQPPPLLNRPGQTFFTLSPSGSTRQDTPDRAIYGHDTSARVQVAGAQIVELQLHHLKYAGVTKERLHRHLDRGEAVPEDLQTDMMTSLMDRMTVHDACWTQVTEVIVGQDQRLVRQEQRIVELEKELGKEREKNGSAKRHGKEGSGGDGGGDQN